MGQVSKYTHQCTYCEKHYSKTLLFFAFRLIYNSALVVCKQVEVLPVFMQSSRKRRNTRIGMHVFSLGRMFSARQEFRVHMFF